MIVFNNAQNGRYYSMSIQTGDLIDDDISYLMIERGGDSVQRNVQKLTFVTRLEAESKVDELSKVRVRNGYTLAA